jgi:hypothetical protein
MNSADVQADYRRHEEGGRTVSTRLAVSPDSSRGCSPVDAARRRSRVSKSIERDSTGERKARRTGTSTSRTRRPYYRALRPIPACRLRPTHTIVHQLFPSRWRSRSSGAKERRRTITDYRLSSGSQTARKPLRRRTSRHSLCNRFHLLLLSG